MKTKEQLWGEIKQEPQKDLDNNQNIIEYKYVGFWYRSGMFILDFLLSFFSLILFLAGWYYEDYIMTDNMVGVFILFLIVNIFIVFYNLYLYYTQGQSIMYKLAGVKIVDEFNYQKPGNWKLFSRFSFKLLLLVLIFIPYVNFIGILVWAFMIGLSKKKQGPHDDITNTIVIIPRNRSYKNIFFVSGILLPILLISWIVTGINDTENKENEEFWAHLEFQKSMLYQMPKEANKYISHRKSYKGFCSSYFNLIIDNVCVDTDDNILNAYEIEPNQYLCITLKDEKVVSTNRIDLINLKCK